MKNAPVGTNKSSLVAELPMACADETAAVEFMERQRWADTPACPRCGDCEVVQMKDKDGNRNKRFLWRCKGCKKQFTVRVGTIMEDSPIPLRFWCLAFYRACASKKGVSALQIKRETGLSYKSALFMMHRIREAMAPAPGSEPPLGGDGFVVEADETYIGKKDGPKGRKARGAGGAGHKRAVLSLVERGGQIRSFKLGAPSQHEVKAMIRANVDPASTLHTYGSRIYTGSKVVGLHESVDHNKA